MKLTVLQAAELEAAAAAIYRQAGLGNEFLSEVSQALAMIGSNPQACSPLEYYTGRYDVRRHVLRRFPFMIVFANFADETLVVAIAHVRRQPLYWLDRIE